MVNGVFKVPSFLKRKQNSSQRFDNTKSAESLHSSPPVKHEKHHRMAADGSGTSEATAIDIPRKKHGQRVRTASGCSGQSSHSEFTPKSRRTPNFSAGSNFSGDSIIHHLDKLSERDQVWFQAYRFGGR